MNLTLKEIAKKKNISLSWATRKMKSQDPVSQKRIFRFSEESVIAVFPEKKEVNFRNIDCVAYSECLTRAAILDVKTMDCHICKKYERT